MNRLGLGRVGWAAVLVLTVMNWFGVLPTVSGVELALWALLMPVMAYLWVRFLKAILSFLLGGGDAQPA